MPERKKQTLPEGLSAVPLPECAQVDTKVHDVMSLDDKEESVKELNSFLKNLNQQGAGIVTIVDLQYKDRGLDIRPTINHTKVAIVKKEKTS